MLDRAGEKMLQFYASIVQEHDPGVIVAAATATTVSVGIAIALFARTLIRDGAMEGERTRAVDATIEALVVVDGEAVVDANRSFLRLSGYASADALPARVTEMFPGIAASSLARAQTARPPSAASLALTGDCAMSAVDPAAELAWHRAPCVRRSRRQRMEGSATAFRPICLPDHAGRPGKYDRVYRALAPDPG